MNLRICKVDNLNNFNRLEVGSLDVWFSYETVVAFRFPGLGLFLTHNIWSRTTGRHLGALRRSFSNFTELPPHEFEEKFNTLLSGLDLSVSLVLASSLLKDDTE